MPAPLVSVSIDLDNLACYQRLHDLPESAIEGLSHVVLRRCLPRFRALFDRLGIRATLFVIGSDLNTDDAGRALLAAMAAEGHELASHSHHHPYDLTRFTPEPIGDELDDAHEIISQVAGTPPVGFRAPGYEITDTLIELLCARGYAYDSSVFPSVPYYLAKATVMGAMRVAGKHAASILGSPRVLRAPTKPYMPRRGDVYAAGTGAQAHPIVELPITVTRALRVPVIGTAVLTAPAPLRALLVRDALAQPFFNFELHGIDLADATIDRLPPALVAKQPDLRVPLEPKARALEATIVAARRAGARIAPLREAVTALGGVAG